MTQKVGKWPGTCRTYRFSSRQSLARCRETWGGDLQGYQCPRGTSSQSANRSEREGGGAIYWRRSVEWGQQARLSWWRQGRVGGGGGSCGGSELSRGGDCGWCWWRKKGVGVGARRKGRGRGAIVCQANVFFVFFSLLAVVWAATAAAPTPLSGCQGRCSCALPPADPALALKLWLLQLKPCAI